MKKITLETYITDSAFELDYDYHEKQLFDVTEQLCEEFGKYLSKEGYEKGLGHGSSFLCHMLFNYLDATLGTCNVYDIEEVIEGLVPRKCVMRNKKEAKEFLKGLILFFEFLKVRYQFPKSEEFIDYLESSEDLFLDLMFDHERAGMGKSIFMNPDGSMPEFDSVEDLERFIMEHNQRIEEAGMPEFDQPERIRQGFKHIDTTSSHKVGRNESCPCGSGKKYKKCCGK